MKVYPFEIIGAKKLYDEERFLLADDMGMFKTAQAIFATSKLRKDLDFRVLTICPNSVKEHWKRELKKWAWPKPKVAILESHTFYDDVKRAKTCDEVIISYPLVSHLNQNGKLDELKKLKFRLIRLDEVHNAKNPEALRTRAVKTLTDKAELVHMLSGTPIPNTIVDIYMLMSLLDPKRYPIDVNDKNLSKQVLNKFYMLFRQNPEEIKRLFHEKMLRRRVEDYIPAKVPKLIPSNPLNPNDPHNISIYLKGDHAAVYHEVLEKDLSFSYKLWQLEKASVDPCLVDPELIENPRLRNRLSSLESQKYKKLDELVEEEVESKGKVVIFTDLKEGVVDKLAKRYERYGAVIIDGDVSPITEEGKESEREVIRKKFQYDKNVKTLIATPTMHEGVDLSAATRGIGLAIPWTPSELYQRIKRSQRPGEIEKDSFSWYNLIAKIQEAESLDQAKFNLLEGKKRVTDFLLETPLSLTVEDLELLTEPMKLPRIKEAVKSTNKKLFEHFLQFRSRGKEKINAFLEKYPGVAKKVADLYPQFGLAQRTADFYKKIIQDIESKQGKLEKKVDLASGPGMLGRILQEQTCAIDIDYNMIEKGRQLWPPNQYIKGTMDTLSLKSDFSDFVLCSLAFQMTNPQDRERERTLRESNRILRKGGYFMITMPLNYLTEKDKRNFYSATGHLGFKLYQEYNGDKKQGMPDIYLFKKTAKPKKTGIDTKHLTFYGDVSKYGEKRK